MNINTIAGNNAYGFANKLNANSEGSATKSGFADMVSNAATGAIKTMQRGESISFDAIAGKASLSEVVTAVNSADIALKSVVAIRDKVINAYQDILKMPI